MVLFCKPRVCGEKAQDLTGRHPVCGSPPRMRGKESIAVGIGDGIGITPAYAGKSDLTSGTQTLLQGSPPHVRGKENGWCKAALPRRITPAYAGKRCRTSRAARSSWDHPRVCGEKLPVRSHARLFWGSPPRMRGKESETGHGIGIAGITPAYAWKSHSALVQRCI